MSRITFKNLPDTSTPLNASNMNSIQNDLVKVIDFTIAAGGTKNITFPDSRTIAIFSSKMNLGNTTECWIIGMYGSGGTSRTDITKISQGSSARAIAYSINNRVITLTNPISDASAICSLVVLIGDYTSITVS